MPEMLAIALRNDGWFLRSRIVWHKPNPMPESISDRPTNSYEHVFLLTKSARYYYDADAVREDITGNAHSPGGIALYAKTAADRDSGIKNNATYVGMLKTLPSSRSLRNVWTIATSPYPNAHFATYPAELAERCIRAGTSERGCCAACGKPWRRITEHGGYILTDSHTATAPNKGHLGAFGERAANMTRDGFIPGRAPVTITTGWQPGCDHNAEVVPCRVLDPFFGAGTAGLVAERLQRDCIGIDLNPDYNVMSRARIEADAPLFTSFPPAEDPEESRIADLFAEAAEE